VVKIPAPSLCSDSFQVKTEVFFNLVTWLD